MKVLPVKPTRACRELARFDRMGLDRMMSCRDRHGPDLVIDGEMMRHDVTFHDGSCHRC